MNGTGSGADLLDYVQDHKFVLSGPVALDAVAGLYPAESKSGTDQSTAQGFLNRQSRLE